MSLIRTTPSALVSDDQLVSDDRIAEARCLLFVILSSVYSHYEQRDDSGVNDSIFYFIFGFAYLRDCLVNTTGLRRPVVK